MESLIRKKSSLVVRLILVRTKAPEAHEETPVRILAEIDSQLGVAVQRKVRHCSVNSLCVALKRLRFQVVLFGVDEEQFRCRACDWDLSPIRRGLDVTLKELEPLEVSLCCVLAHSPNRFLADFVDEGQVRQDFPCH